MCILQSIFAKIFQMMLKNNRPRLLHLIPFAALGGTEKNCLYFIEASRDEYEQRVWVLDGEGPMVGQWREAGAHVSLLHILHLSQREFIRRLSAYAAAEDFDGILYWSTIKLPLVRYAMRGQRCRMAVHVGNPANFKLLSVLKQMVDHVLYPSPVDTRLFACSQYVLRSLGIHPYYRYFSATVSYNPVRLLERNPYVARPLDKDREVIIGMTARLDPIKDHPTLLIAFKSVVAHYPHARLWLIGDGMLRCQLEQLAHQLGISSNVVFWGNVEDVYGKLQQMDIFVYSTTPREGLGNALSEALACGLPCVVSDLPMMHEITGDDFAAIFFKPNSAEDLAVKIVELLNSEDQRKVLSQNGFNRALANFDAKRFAYEYLNFLRPKL